jgi:WD40 repeat protein
VSILPHFPPPPADPAQTHLVGEHKHAAPLLGCRFDPSGRYAFACGQDRGVERWELSSGTKTTLSGPGSWARALAFAAREKLVFSGAYDGRVLAWPIDGDGKAPAKAWEAHDGWVRALDVSPDGRLLATCGNDALVRLWSVPDGKPVRTLEGHGCHVYNVAFHPSGSSLVSGDLKGVLKVWDVKTGAATRELDARVLHKYDPSFMADHGGIRGMAFGPGGVLLACAGITDVSNAFAGVGKPLVVLFDWASGKVKHLLRPKEAFQGTAWGTFIHPSGFVAAAGGGNGAMLWFWKTDAGQESFALKLPASARDLALHPDGRRLAVACADGALRVYFMGPKKK